VTDVGPDQEHSGEVVPPGTRRIATGLVGAAALIAVITVVARIVGFARIVVFARTVGPASCLGNAYFTANTVPNIVFEIVAGGALASMVVPVLAGPAARGEHQESARTVSALLTWSVLLLTPFAIAGIWLAHPVMHLLVGGSGRCDSGQVVSSGARMLLVFLPQIVLYGVGIVLVGTLQAHRRFAGPALAPLLSSLVVIATYLVFAAAFSGNPNNLSDVSRADQLILAVGTTLGVVALSLSLLVPLHRLGLRLRPTLQFPMGVAPRVRALALAGVATLAAQEAAVVVVLRLANDSGPRGAVTVYNLAWTVFLLPWAVLAVPIATSAFPRLSEHVDQGDADQFARTAARSTRAVLLVTFVATAVLIAAAQPIARVLAQHGPGATTSDVNALARAIAAFAPGLIGYGLIAHLGRALYAHGRGRTAALATVAGWVAVIVADVIFVTAASQADAVPALALGNTVGMTVAGVLLAVALVQSSPGALRGCARTAALALAAAAVAATAGRLLANVTSTNAVAANVAVGVLAGLLCVAVFVGIVALVDRKSLIDLRDRATTYA
jgi:putative peptidoglycan lipid II flippase